MERPSLYLVEAVFLWRCGWSWLCIFGAADTSAFASIFKQDSLLAGGTEPGEVSEEGQEVVLEESDALCPRELAVVAFCAFHRCLRWARLAQPQASKRYGG